MLPACFCILVRREVENGELPSDLALLGKMVRNVCFGNAEQYVNLDLDSTSSATRASAVATSSDSDRLLQAKQSMKNFA